MGRDPDVAEDLLRLLETFQGLGGPRERAELGSLGDYRLLRQVGRGGMGIVYEAHQASMDRRVALKVLPAGLGADARTISRFIREAQVAGKLQHPNIVPVYGMGVEAGTPYYAMEFVEGETLAEVLKREPEATPQEAYRWAEAFAGVAEGLREAHQKGIIHRDLKPSNLIVDCTEAASRSLPSPSTGKEERRHRAGPGGDRAPPGGPRRPPGPRVGPP
jgi:serine/threonine protein kinase